MTRALTVVAAGPSMSVQDLGRPGFRAEGLTAGGAVDVTALYEGAALLGQGADLAALEMAGSGGTFRAEDDLRIALTGARMTATLDGAPLAWDASHAMPKDAVLAIGGARDGSYGYLHIGGGFAPEPVMGSRSSHLRAGIGAVVRTGDTLATGPDKATLTGQTLPRDNRFAGGTVRMVSSMQTALFDDDTLARFAETAFRRDPRGDRMGIRLDHDGKGFGSEGQRSIVSEVVVPGDIQVTGDGAPFVLMCECQTTGGYPRIGTVLPCDLPLVAQAPPGAALRIEPVDLDTAIAAERRYRTWRAGLADAMQPLLRDPARMKDLLGYQLIGGAVSALADPYERET